MSEIFTPSGEPTGYRGERCGLCQEVLPAEDRLEHVRMHERQGALVQIGGSPEDPYFTAESDVVAALADFHCRRRPPVHRSSDTIHLLLHGQVFCGFSRSVPRDWPEGHWWVDIADREEANCAPCVDAYAVTSGEVEL